MDNMGGLRKLYYILADDIQEFVLSGTNTYSLVFAEGKSWNEIIFTQESGRFSETEEMTDNGLAYNYEVSCRVPRISPDSISLFGDLRLKELLILVEDNNGYFWITGRPGTWFNIMISSDTGENIQDRNSRQLRISAQLPEASIYSADPFTNHALA